MKVHFSKITWRLVSGMSASLILLVSFQNCGKAGFDAELDTAIDSPSSDASLIAKYGETTAPKVQNIPFAFDAAFDTITYNSCAENHIRSNNAFTSLKAGAYFSGGLTIKSDFFSYVEQNFKPVYPETTLSINRYKEYLHDSPANSGSVLAMALRVKNSLEDIYTTNSTVTLSKDVIPMVSNLTDPLVMDTIIQKGVKANYFPFSPEKKTIEGELNFNNDESLADEFRNTLMSSGVLALTYMVNETEIERVRSPSSAQGPVKTAYGKGYSLSFAPFPIAGAAVNNPNHILSQVVETNLESPTVGAKTWNCSNVYAIVRVQDAPVVCPAQSYDEIKGNATYRAKLAIARRHLRADQWDVNVKLNCAVPKGGVSCYKEESINNSPVVQYDLTKECFRPNGSYAGAIPDSRCLHFITICTRP